MTKDSILKKLEPVIVEGDKYYTANQFALITGKSLQTIRNLIHQPNKSQRQIQSVKLIGKVLIPVEELTTYQWRERGKDTYYTFDENGEKVYC